MIQNIRLRLLSYLVIFYMLLAFTWWSVLLFVKNKDAFNAKSELLKIGMVAEGTVTSESEFYNTAEFQELDEKYKRQEYMIFGEAAVFVVSLVIGVWLINRGYNKEMNAAQQRRNFLLSITHELKSPIASIKLVLETFLKRKLTLEQVNKLGSNGIKDADRLNKLVNNLLLAAKVEIAYQPTFEEINITGLAEDIVNQIKNNHPVASISLDYEDDISLMQGDVFGLSSVISNLIENGIKYSKETAKINVHLKQVKKKIIIQIQDQGIGISNEEKKKIFEKFYRVGNEDTRQTKGTGLGLYIVDQIIKAHQGSITVGDNSPEGSIFTISLPKEQV